jgi:1-acyl-sn-glycerol-3-phosphate acyltransferase
MHMFYTLVAGLRILWMMASARVRYQVRRFRGRAPDRDVLFRQSRAFAHHVMTLTRTRLVVRGGECLRVLPAGRPVVIVSNHESYLDIPAIMAAMPWIVGFVAKKELARIPLLGYWIRELGGVMLDRKNLRKSHETLSGIRSGGCHGALLVFPEGTRNKAGTVAAFKPGSLRLAFDRGALIVPVCIAGSRRKFEGNRYRIRAGNIHVRIFEPVDTQMIPTSQKAGLAKRLEEMIRKAHNAPP